jgi:hypothetical protein
MNGSMITVEIKADTYFTCLALLRERQQTQPDVRAANAMVDLQAAVLKEVDREIASVAEPNSTPALLRKQAG